jgi:hypothetical protein
MATKRVSIAIKGGKQRRKKKWGWGEGKKIVAPKGF